AGSGARRGRRRHRCRSQRRVRLRPRSRRRKAGVSPGPGTQGRGGGCRRRRGPAASRECTSGAAAAGQPESGNGRSIPLVPDRPRLRREVRASRPNRERFEQGEHMKRKGIVSSMMVAAAIVLAAGRAGAADPPAAKPFSAAQLEQLVAPIALYPDPLMAQILMASTYPLEIVEASRWLKKNPGLKGDKLDAALK